VRRSKSGSLAWQRCAGGAMRPVKGRRPASSLSPDVIERKRPVDFWHHQHGMSYALRPGTEASYVPRRAKWFIGDLTTVEHLHTVTRRVAEGNNLSGATLVRHSGDFPPHRDAGLFQPRRLFGRKIEKALRRIGRSSL
jgi:hypothetical protein